MSSFPQLGGITSSIPSGPTSVDLFELFLTPSIIESIVNQTYLYVSQMSIPPQGWKPCTSDRLRSFLGLVIAMGIKRLPYLRDYWSQVLLLGCPDLISSWPCQQFCALLRYFNDKATAIPKGQPGYDCLHKVRLFLELVLGRCKMVYKPERELALEAMIGFKVRSSLKQYLPMKP